MLDELLNELKLYLDIVNEEQDDFLKNLITYMEDYIYRMYDVAIFSRTISERLKMLHGLGNLYTKNSIITTINSVKVSDYELPEEGYQIVSANLIYVTDEKALLTYSKDIFEVEYVVGYDDVTVVPPALKNALFILVKKTWNDAQKDNDAYDSINIGIKQGVHPVPSIPVMVQNTLASFKTWRL